MTAVLQVDSSMRPLGFVDPFRAFCMVWEGKAFVLEEDETRVMRSPSVEFPTPLVIQVPQYVKLRPLKDKVIIKRVLYARDGWKCQYCGEAVNAKTATVDHVKPKIYFIKEGRPASDANTWDNVVTSCGPCNWKKGGRLPVEARMKLIDTRAPKKPDFVQTLWAGRTYHPIHAKYVAQFYPKLEGDIRVLNLVGEDDET
jgi:5-methylcytosine-specific restriction endonuclease McrA